MKYLKLYENYLPNDQEVKEILDYLNDKYTIKSDTILDKPVKYIMIDDKPIYLTGIFHKKKYNTNKIYNDIIDDLSKYEVGSVRKSIKTYIDQFN